LTFKLKLYVVKIVYITFLNKSKIIEVHQRLTSYNEKMLPLINCEKKLPMNKCVKTKHLPKIKRVKPKRINHESNDNLLPVMKTLFNIERW